MCARGGRAGAVADPRDVLDVAAQDYGNGTARRRSACRSWRGTRCSRRDAPAHAHHVAPTMQADAETRGVQIEDGGDPIQWRYRAAHSPELTSLVTTLAKCSPRQGTL